MARVLIPSGPEWFDELKAVNYYNESDLERVIKQHVADLFPGFLVFPFKQGVRHSTTGIVKKPDLGMLREDYGAWGIIEVETSDHDFDHVLEQTECFAQGAYNAPLVTEYIRKQIAEHYKDVNLELAKLKNLVATARPLVVVIADKYVEEWREPLNDAGVELCIFETFKNTRGHFLYRTFGPYPVVPIREAHCRRHKTLSNVWEIVRGFDFRVKNADDEVEIAFDANMTRWSTFDDAGVSYLRFLGKTNPLSPNNTYVLFADQTERYYLRIN